MSEVPTNPVEPVKPNGLSETARDKELADAWAQELADAWAKVSAKNAKEVHGLPETASGKELADPREAARAKHAREIY